MRKHLLRVLAGFMAAFVLISPGGCGKKEETKGDETGAGNELIIVTPTKSEEDLALEAEYMEALRLNGNSKTYDFGLIETLSGNPMEGKTLCILGSSVVDGYASGHHAVGEYFEKRLGCTLIKEAVSGTTLADLEDNSYVSRLKKNIDAEKVDLFICQLSTNDATKNVTLGEVSDSRNMSDFDTKTVIGAMEYIIRYAQATWNCPVVFFTGSYYNSANYAKMVEALYKLRDKWGIGVLDLYNNDDFNAVSDEDRAIFMADDIHPKRAGYRDWWGPEMEKQLLDFLK